MKASVLEKLSIKQKMRYLRVFIAFIMIIASMLVFFTLEEIELKYNNLQNNATAGAIYTLEIEKDLNYVSRISRDIMLGNSYDKNLEKLISKVEAIKKNFSNLEEISNNDSINLISNAKESTYKFLDKSLEMMKNLNQEEISKNTASIYAKYKQELTPYAELSRKNFENVLHLKRENFNTAKKDMHTKISNYKTTVVFYGFVTTLLIFIFASFIQHSILSALSSFTQIIEKVSNGIFIDTRIEVVDETELGIMGGSLEKLIYQMKNFIYEIDISINNAVKGDFKRAISNEGMLGDFVDSIALIQSSISVMQNQENQKQRDILNSQLSVMSIEVNESLSVIQKDLEKNISNLKTVTRTTKDAATLSDSSRLS